MTQSSRAYAAQAGELIARYESVSFVDKHASVMHLIPAAPSAILDIGAGTGADAAFLAAGGHHVVALEPTAEFRAAGAELHPSGRIEWINDCLPDLAAIRSRGQQFDLVMITAVWMHLDEQERRRAMPHVASLLRRGGVLTMSLRHGPAPAGRAMYQVGADETSGLARDCNLRCILSERNQSVQEDNRRAGITWTYLAFTN